MNELDKTIEMICIEIQELAAEKKGVDEQTLLITALAKLVEARTSAWRH